MTENKEWFNHDEYDKFFQKGYEDYLEGRVSNIPKNLTFTQLCAWNDGRVVGEIDSRILEKESQEP